MDRGIPGSTSHRGRLSVDVEHHGESAVIAPHGELDHHTADVLSAALESCVEEGDKRLVVDCSGLEFCDSTGLNVLLSARLSAEAVGGAVHLAQMSPLVARLFEITGAGAVFTLHESLADALDTSATTSASVPAASEPASEPVPAADSPRSSVPAKPSASPASEEPSGA